MSTSIPITRDTDVAFSVYFFSDEISDSKPRILYNSTIHNYNTRRRIQLHKPSATLALYQKGPYYESIRIYNALPHNIAEMILQKKGFLTKLKKYLLAKAFYSVQEYMNDYTDRQDGK